jgi:hypothetical protein
MNESAGGGLRRARKQRREIEIEKVMEQPLS